MTYSNTIQDGQNGLGVLIDGFRHMVVAEQSRLTGGNSETNVVDPIKWNSILVGSGTITPSAGVFTLATGVTANSAATLQANRRARFISGTNQHYLAGMRLGDTGTANNVRRWGAYDSTDGCYFVLNGTTFGVGTRNTSVDTVVTTGFVNPLVLDTNFHVYELEWSAGTVYFYQDRLLIYKATATTSGIMGNLHQLITAENVNSGGSTTNVNLFVRGQSISRNGRLDATASFFHVSTNTTATLKSSPGLLRRVCINSTGSGATTLTAYDNTSATGTVLGIFNTNDSIGVYAYELEFTNGLTIVTTGGISPADITIVFE